MVAINWTFNALEDLANIGDYHSLQSERYAKMLIDKLLFATDVLIRFPNIGRVVPEFHHDSVRELVSSPYRIVYRIVSATRIDILTVHHSSRPIDGTAYL
jgi:toxin ParE1/3/4